MNSRKIQKDLGKDWERIGKGLGKFLGGGITRKIEYRLQSYPFMIEHYPILFVYCLNML